MKKIVRLFQALSTALITFKMAFAASGEMIQDLTEKASFSLLAPMKSLSFALPDGSFDSEIAARNEDEVPFLEKSFSFPTFQWNWVSPSSGETISDSTEMMASEKEEETPQILVNETPVTPTVIDSESSTTLVASHPSETSESIASIPVKESESAVENHLVDSSKNSSSSESLMLEKALVKNEKASSLSEKLNTLEESPYAKGMTTSTLVGPPSPKKIRVRLTFYSGQDDQWGSQVAWNKVHQASRGRTAAADPNLFPYGTWIHIPGFGVHRIEDTGTAVKARTASGGKDPVIDLYVGEESEVHRLSTTTPEYVDIILL
ncbi:MAG: 3D domain-containing protein [Verrucomicrobiota bacterium]